ncbi:MAG TPA: prolipoprotein diacylglyceryl transferase [Acidimicrobiia bacterium]
MLASIPSPSNGTIDIGPIPVHAYGLLLAIGVLVATWIAQKRWVSRGGDRKAFDDLVIWVVIGGVVGARVYHLFTGYDWDAGGIAGTVKIWEGGLSIWGVMAGGAIAVLLVCRVKRLDTLMLFDCIVPGLLAAQALGRWGNWFNQELFGRPTDLPWGLEIDPVNRPAEYLTEPTFHPTFLYESLYCVLLIALLLWAERRFRFRKGQALAFYLATYTFGRFFFENLRVDPSEKLFGLRFNAWVSALICIGATAWFIWLGRHGRDYERDPESGVIVARASATASESR